MNRAILRSWLFQPNPPTFFAFGKTPNYGDFVEFNVNGAPWLKLILDDLATIGHRGHPNPWFDLDNVPRLVHLERRRWFRRSQSAAFRMEPSSDSHGRRFPLMLGWYQQESYKPTQSDDIRKAMETEQDIRGLLTAWNIPCPEAIITALLELATATPEMLFSPESQNIDLQRQVVARFEHILIPTPPRPNHAI